LEIILAAAAGESSLQMVSFTNQPPGKRSVPDARISAQFAYWFESRPPATHSAPSSSPSISTT
jgi:hypothetical protein